MNKYQTELTEELINSLPQEVQDQLFDTINNVEFVKRLISPTREYAKDRPRDKYGRIIVDLANPHILEDMDYFRPTALHYQKYGTFTNLRPNSNPNSEYGKWLKQEVHRCWDGYIRESDGEWVTGYMYFKDDDSRLSFLQGNYLTLTNMSEHDIDRIIQYKLSPINISFQTMNPELRCKMLHNRFAGEIFDKVKRLKDAGIIMNGQIVLCRGVNDGAELERSIRELTAYMPQLESVSVVPVGLTRYRDGLYPLEPFTKEDACEVLDLIHGWQEKLYKEWGNHFIHAGDEWYILAERPIPEEKTYDGDLQLENGVGMVRLLDEEVAQTLAGMTGDDRKIHRTIATGELAAPFLRKHVESVRKKYPNVDIQVLAIKNEFFGGMITVAGLITGRDLISQLMGIDLGDGLLLTNHMLKSGEPVFLDDVTVDDVQNALQIKVSIVESSGADFVSSLIED